MSFVAPSVPFGSTVRHVCVAMLFLNLVVAGPVLAQESSTSQEDAPFQGSSVCDVERLPQMIEGFFQLTTALGVVGLAVVWQADSLVDMFTLHPEQKKGLKRHKRSATKSAVILVVLGPLYSVAGPMMGFPLAECITLAP